MKKKLASIGIAFCLGAACVMMSACGDDTSKIEYTSLPTIIEEMSTSTSGMLETTTIDHVSSKFILSPLNNSANNYFNECLIIPINYISKYNSQLSLLKDKTFSGEQQQAIDNLEIDLASFKVNYTALVSEYDRLVTFTDKSSVIYEGALQQFKYKATDFISSTYEVAISLADVQKRCLNIFSDMVTTNLGEFNMAQLRDYLALQVGYDYYKVLLESSNSNNFVVNSEAGTITLVNLINSTKTKLTNFIRDFYGATTLKNLTKVDVTEGDNITYKNIGIKKLLSAQEDFASEREFVAKSFEKFSLYKFYNTYHCNLQSAMNDEAYADVYYSKIQSYYKTYLPNYTDYLKSILI